MIEIVSAFLTTSSVLPADYRMHLVVEASTSFGYHKCTGFEVDAASTDRFGI